MGLRVARMVAEVADAETALAKAASQAAAAEEGVSPIPASWAEAIEADRAAAAAAEARHTVVARADVVARAFARVSRSIRLTAALLERFDRGWAGPTRSDDRRAMAKRQIARGVADVIAREAEGERAERLTESLTERLDTPDWEDEFEDLPVEEVIARICRDLGLDPVRGTVKSPLPGDISQAEMDEVFPRSGGRPGWQGPPPHRQPDG